MQTDNIANETARLASGERLLRANDNAAGIAISETIRTRVISYNAASRNADQIDFDYVANVARVNAASLAMLASAPARPKSVTMTTGLSNDTDLKWEANKEPDVAGYEVVWRDTTAATWTNSRPVGNVMTYTLKGMSKDNYSFGVRAVDRQGNRSPVTYPRPAARTQTTPRTSSRRALP
jgi:hypothetical protein